MMKNFIEKWNNDSRFKAKIKLGLYTLFVAIVSIYALSIRNANNITNTYDPNNDNNQKEDEIINIKIPQEYSYIINITIDDNKYQYIGTKLTSKETITKIVNNTSTNYIYQENKYYKEEAGNYLLITKDEIYDMVGYNYLNLETINQYLSKSKTENENYVVYLKDIILGSDSEDYITITLKDNKINVDYTSLMKVFNNTINNYSVEIIIEEKE